MLRNLTIKTVVQDKFANIGDVNVASVKQATLVVCVKKGDVKAVIVQNKSGACR